MFQRKCADLAALDSNLDCTFYTATTTATFSSHPYISYHILVLSSLNEMSLSLMLPLLVVYR